MSARLIGFCLALFSALFLLFANPVFAQNQTIASQSATQDSSQSAALKTPYFSPQSPQYANLVVINLLHSFSCLAEGLSIIGQPCLVLTPTNNSPSKPISMVPDLGQFQTQGGALESVNGLISNIYYTPPVRVSEYLADAGQDMGIVKPTYAAELPGSGNQVLRPVLILWKISRNIAYLGLIFVLLVIGLMIMFRQKINPQTVISAQSAIPSVIIGLVLITFSYFLAALLVDLTFVSTHFVGEVLKTQVIQNIQVTDESDPTKTLDPIDNLLKNHSILSIYNFFVDGGGVINGTTNSIDPTNVIGETQGVVNSLQSDHTLGSIISEASSLGGCVVANQLGLTSGLQTGLEGLADVFDSVNVEPAGVGANGTGIGNALKFLAKKIVNSPAVKVINSKAGKKITSSKFVNCAVGGSLAYLLASNTGVIGGMAGLILYLVLMLALLAAMFKLLFALIGAYIAILISTITAPLQFLVGSIPGRQGVITSWIKGMIANLLAFPAVFLALIFAAFIVNWTGAPFYIDSSIYIGFGGGSLPLLGGLSSGFLRLILAYGILLTAPHIPEMIKGSMGIKDNLNFTKAALGGIGAGFNTFKGAFGGLTRRFAEERKTYLQYANLVRVYGAEEVAHKYGKINQPSIAAPWQWLGTGMTPRHWREQRKAVELKEEAEEKRMNESRANAAAADKARMTEAMRDAIGGVPIGGTSAPSSEGTDEGGSEGGDEGPETPGGGGMGTPPPGGAPGIS